MWVVKKGTQVTLNTGEQEVCKLIAKLKFNSNRANGIRNSRRGPQSDFETDLEGIAAELAFCKLTNKMPDFSLEPRSSQKKEDENGDVVINGLKIDIKTTKYKTGRLAVVPWKKANVDYYVLMVGTFPSYEYKGAFKKTELFQEQRAGDLGYGKTYIAQQSELIDLPF